MHVQSAEMEEGQLHPRLVPVALNSTLELCDKPSITNFLIMCNT